MKTSKVLPGRNGLNLAVHLEPDTDTHPDDYDCFDDIDVAAWRNDEWSYVVVVVTASLRGYELASAALSSVQCGQLPGESGFTDPLDLRVEWAEQNIESLIAQVLPEAKAELGLLVAAAGRIL